MDNHQGAHRVLVFLSTAVVMTQIVSSHAEHGSAYNLKRCLCFLPGSEDVILPDFGEGFGNSDGLLLDVGGASSLQ